MPSPVPEQLERLRGVLEPVVAGAGFEIDDLEVRAAGRTHIVKVVVDVPADSEASGVGLDAIARLSRAAAEELDGHEHLIAGSYTLEVTSPGVDRPLTRPQHWRRARQRLVRVTTAAGTRDLRAGRAGPDAVDVVEAGAKKPAREQLRYADVTRAVVQVEFNAPPAAELEALGLAAEAGAEDRAENEEQA
ncbi:ribosome maturation factor RimP [Pseudonocardia ailaonensis]|uniref:Ribosome maturation factor RimP n=1 Tax=Pseudonocardia ailaonensis TaxID=367279 RepID=A0ABN2MJU9_9PSEU